MKGSSGTLAIDGFMTREQRTGKTERQVTGLDGFLQSVQRKALGEESPQLALLISCVGRKMVLKQRIEEEVEAVREVLGADTMLTGFYSYGEISPIHRPGKCELLNQTMTITTLTESGLE